MLPETLQYVGIPASAGNPGLSYWRTTDAQKLGALPQQIKGSEGSIFALIFRNANTTPAYVNFYDLPSGKVTVGTTAPKWRIMIPAALDSSNPGQLIITAGFFPVIWFAGGITIAAITTDSDAGSTAPSTSLTGSLQYA